MRSHLLPLLLVAPLAAFAAPSVYESRVDTALSSSSRRTSNIEGNTASDWRVFFMHKRTRNVPMPLSHPHDMAASLWRIAHPRHRPAKHVMTPGYFNSEHTANASETRFHSRIAPRSPQVDTDNVLNSQVDQLCAYRDSLLSISGTLGNLAALSSSQGLTDSLFQQQCTSQIASFQQALSGYQNLLSSIGGDKGIGNLDRANQVEVSLNDVVTAVKNILLSIDEVLYNIPVVGGTAGPIVYAVKCNLDDILNATEDLSDGSMNSLLNIGGMSALISPLIVSATNTACGCDLPTSLFNICL